MTGYIVLATNYGLPPEVRSPLIGAPASLGEKPAWQKSLRADSTTTAHGKVDVGL